MKQVILILFMTGGFLFPRDTTETLSAPSTSLTLTVNRTGDGSDLNPGDGLCDASVNVGEQCSLRAAIEEINSQGVGATPHNIEFNIPGTGPFTISPGSNLPQVTVPVEIDGETQPGSSCPSEEGPAELMIILDGSNSSSGLFLGVGSGGSTLHGLMIVNFANSGTWMLSNSTASCNHLDNNFYGINVLGSGNTIGGQDVSHRNVISNNVHGIVLHTNDNIILNNFIGTTANGMGLAGNLIAGIYIMGNNNLVGGANSSISNVISGNGVGVIVSSGNNNTILGNYIGVTIDGTSALPNSYQGIRLEGLSSGNKIGGTISGEANLISYNRKDGVSLFETFGNFPVQNEIRGNSISKNGGIGIDLGGDGVTVNDPGDNDGQANEQQNYPVLSISQGNSTLTISLDSWPDTLFDLDLYRNDRCDSSHYGEGQQYLDTIQVTTDGFGQANFDKNIDGMVYPNDIITATATDPLGNTSEFSNCVRVVATQSENIFYLPVMQR
jgi:CSLREA domain-containing protein